MRMTVCKVMGKHNALPSQNSALNFRLMNHQFHELRLYMVNLAILHQLANETQFEGGPSLDIYWEVNIMFT